MTLDEMVRSDKVMLTPTDVAEVLGCKSYSINLQAQRDPKALGFPVIVLGNRVHIPREGFLHFLKYGRALPDGGEIDGLGA